MFRRNKEDLTARKVNVKNLYLAETVTNSSSSRMDGIVCVKDVFIVEKRKDSYYEFFSGVELEISPFYDGNDDDDPACTSYFDVPYIVELSPVQKHFKPNSVTIRGLFFFLNEMKARIYVDNEYMRTHSEIDPNDLDDFEEDTDEESSEESDEKTDD